jgi:hypothetical protein
MEYRAKAGLSYPASARDLQLCKQGQPHARVEIAEGEIAKGLPSESVPWLLEDGRIEEVKNGALRK